VHPGQIEPPWGLTAQTGATVFRSIHADVEDPLAVVPAFRHVQGHLPVHEVDVHLGERYEHEQPGRRNGGDRH
jgi:hypothetical protein